MRKTRTLLAFILALVMAASMMTTAWADEPAAGEAGKVIHWQINSVIATLDSVLSNDETTCGILSQLIEGLYTKDANGALTLGMASDVQTSEDGLTWTYTIRDDAYWSNGLPVTAGDFEFAWKRVADPASASDYQWMITNCCFLNAEDVVSGAKPASELGVTALDDKTLEIKLSVPCPILPMFLIGTTFSPINEAFFNECGDNYATAPEYLLCNGPFVLTEYQPSAMIAKAVKNDKFYGADGVQVDGIEWLVVLDSQTAVMAYESGSLDYAKIDGSLIEQYEDSDEFSTRSDGYEWYLAPNFKTEGLDNLNIRLALSKSFNKEAITKSILKDGSAITNGVVPAGLAASTSGVDFREQAGDYDAFTYDVAAAQEYWKAGLAELGVESLTYELICDDPASCQEIAQFLQNEWQTNLPGLTIELKVEPKKARNEDMQAGNYDIGLTRWGPDYGDPMTYIDMWETSSSTNYGKWSNAEYDEIIASAKTGELALDTDARWDALLHCEQMLADDCVIFPLYTQSAAQLIKPNVKNIHFYALGIPYILKDVTIE